jgi:uncharacterized protein (DUF302 family)
MKTLSSSLLLALTLLATSIPGFAQTPAPSAQPDPRAIVSENVSRAGFADTLKILKEQLAADGWNLLAEINLGERLAKKNVSIPGGMVILDMTSGGNTVPLLKNEETRYVAGLMPCSVAIYGMADGRVIISRMNAGLLADMMEPRVAEVMNKSARQLDASIARALARLGS